MVWIQNQDGVVCMGSSSSAVQQGRRQPDGSSVVGIDSARPQEMHSTYSSLILEHTNSSCDQDPPHESPTTLPPQLLSPLGTQVPADSQHSCT